jgi:hypothetical protein
MTHGDAIPLDLSRFTSPLEGLRLVSESRRELLEAAASTRPAESGAFLLRQLGLGTVIAAAIALHDGAVREAVDANPHACLTLIRGLVEVFAVANYLSHDPDYIESLLVDPAKGSVGARKPKKMQALIDVAVRDGNRGLGHVYAQLCDVAHFGRGAMGIPLRSYEEDGEPGVTLNILPHWTSELHATNALAMIEEHTLAIAALLRRYHDDHIAPLIADPAAAAEAGQVLGNTRPRSLPEAGLSAHEP